SVSFFAVSAYIFRPQSGDARRAKRRANLGIAESRAFQIVVIPLRRDAAHVIGVREIAGTNHRAVIAACRLHENLIENSARLDLAVHRAVQSDAASQTKTIEAKRLSRPTQLVKHDF